MSTDTSPHHHFVKAKRREYIYLFDEEQLEAVAGVYLAFALSKRSLSTVSQELGIPRKSIQRWEEGGRISRLSAIAIIVLCETSRTIQHWGVTRPSNDAYHSQGAA